VIFDTVSPSSSRRRHLRLVANRSKAAEKETKIQTSRRDIIMGDENVPPGRLLAVRGVHKVSAFRSFLHVHSYTITVI